MFSEGGGVSIHDTSSAHSYKAIHYILQPIEQNRIESDEKKKKERRKERSDF